MNIKHEDTKRKELRKNTISYSNKPTTLNNLYDNGWVKSRTKVVIEADNERGEVRLYNKLGNREILFNKETGIARKNRGGRCVPVGLYHIKHSKGVFERDIVPYMIKHKMKNFDIAYKIRDENTQRKLGLRKYGKLIHDTNSNDSHGLG